MAELVLVFGLDGMALLAFVLALRCHYGLGRAAAAAPEESAWLLQAAWTSIQQINAYLLSDQVGDWTLEGLVAGILSAA